MCKFMCKFVLPSTGWPETFLNITEKKESWWSLVMDISSVAPRPPSLVCKGLFPTSFILPNNFWTHEAAIQNRNPSKSCWIPSHGWAGRRDHVIREQNLLADLTSTEEYKCNKFCLYAMLSGCWTDRMLSSTLFQRSTVEVHPVQNDKLRLWICEFINCLPHFSLHMSKSITYLLWHDNKNIIVTQYITHILYMPVQSVF